MERHFLKLSSCLKGLGFGLDTSYHIELSSNQYFMHCPTHHYLMHAWGCVVFNYREPLEGEGGVRQIVTHIISGAWKEKTERHMDIFFGGDNWLGGCWNRVKAGSWGALLIFLNGSTDSDTRLKEWSWEILRSTDNDTAGETKSWAIKQSTLTLKIEI